MERIKEKPTSVLVPIIDVIEAKNFYYSTNGYDTFQVSQTTSFKSEITSETPTAKASLLAYEDVREPEFVRKPVKERKKKKMMREMFAKKEFWIVQCHFELEDFRIECKVNTCVLNYVAATRRQVSQVPSTMDVSDPR